MIRLRGRGFQGRLEMGDDSCRFFFFFAGDPVFGSVEETLDV